MVVSEEVVLPNGLPEADIAEASKGEDGSQSTAEGASCKSKHSPAPSTDSFSSSYTPTLYHVDTNTTIVLNAELITSKAQKAVRLWVFCFIVAAFAAFAVVITLKSWPREFMTYNPHPMILVNACVGGVLTVMLAAVWVRFVQGYLAARASGKTWKRRRRVLALIAFAQLCTQLINAIFFFVPNVFLLPHQCAWEGWVANISGYIRWTCWNTVFFLIMVHGRNLSPLLNKKGELDHESVNVEYGDPLILDSGPRHHILAMVKWIIFEASVVVLAVLSRHYPEEEVAVDRLQGCVYHSCNPPVAIKVVTTIWAAMLIGYFIMITHYSSQASKRLAQQPYNTFLPAQNMLRWQRSQMSWAYSLGVCCVPIIWFSNWTTCVSYYLSWFGFLPLQIIMGGMVLANSYYFMPTNPTGKDAILQAWLREFAWTEASCAGLLQVRAEQNPGLNAEECTEVFCMESTLKMHLFSSIVYSHPSTLGAISEEGSEEGGGSPKKRSKSGSFSCWRVCGCHGDEDSNSSTTPQGVIRSTWTPSPSGKASSYSRQTSGSGLGSGPSRQLSSRSSTGADSIAPRETAEAAEGAARGSPSTFTPGSASDGIERQAETAADASVGKGAPAPGGTPLPDTALKERRSAHAAAGTSGSGKLPAPDHRPHERACASEPHGHKNPFLERGGSFLRRGLTIATGQPGNLDLNVADGTLRQPAGTVHEASEGHAQGLEDFHMGGGKGDDFVLEDKQHDVKLQIEEEVSSEEQLHLAMGMYGLTELEVFHETVLDTKVLIAWNGRTAVLSFRGTSSLANVLSDLRAWRTPHLPLQGRMWMGTRPMVHSGFMRSWLSNGLNERVLAHVMEITKSADVPLSEFEMFVTGHSLGGALATLASFDIQKQLRLPRLHCITFGAPRTGNHAFARAYGELVPDTWHVINDTDAVPRMGKFLTLYKRPGQRVLIDTMGDIVVRPSCIELSLRARGMSVKNHYLTSYTTALSTILRAQLAKTKGLRGGREGVLRLSHNPALATYLALGGFNLDEEANLPPEEVQQNFLQQAIKGEGKSLLARFKPLNWLLYFPRGFITWIVGIEE